ncbi:MAG: DUF3297 family protein [Burkholderiales bacterium]|nr:DUF3297 family protein [Burkholderiales bacterium]
MNEPTQPPPLPDHLSIDPRSPHHVAAVFEHDVRIQVGSRPRINASLQTGRRALLAYPPIPCWHCAAARG